MKQYLKRSWDYIIIEPFTWLFVAFFHPAEFAPTYERERITQRIGTMFRMVIPLLLTSYLFMLFVRLIRVVLTDRNLIFTYNPYSIDNFFILSHFVLLSLALGLLFIVLDSLQFGITFCIGASIAFTMLSILMRLFNPAENNYPFPYSFPANLLTGFAIGILFATAFAIKDDTPVKISKGIIRGIGFGIVLLVILQHLEYADFQDLWLNIHTNNSLSILIGCIATGIALSVAGDIIIDSTANFIKRFDRMIIRGVTGGIIFAITFAFILFLISLYNTPNSYANDIHNLSMVSILLGFVGGFLGSMKGSLIRGLIITIGIIIVVMLLVSPSYNPIFSFPLLKMISSNTSPYTFVYQLTLGLAFGIVGGSISSNKKWKTLSWICILIFLLELANLLVGGLTKVFVNTFELSIISSITSGLVSGIIIGLVIVFIKNMDRGLARGIIFTIATVIAASSLAFVKSDSSAYTDIRTAAIIGIGCLIGYILVYYRIHLYQSPQRTLSAIKKNYQGRYVPWSRLLIFVIFAIILLIIILVIGAFNPLVSLILTILGLLLGLFQWLFPPQSNKNKQDIADTTSP